MLLGLNAHMYEAERTKYPGSCEIRILGFENKVLNHMPPEKMRQVVRWTTVAETEANHEPKAAPSLSE
jgi:hypothetical protein